jgi:hypothetical protein
MYYSLQDGEKPVYQTDSEGNIKYIEVDGVEIPIETGEVEIAYTLPAEFFANMAMSGGEAEAKEYGLTTADYDCTLLCERNAYPLKEGSLVWIKSEIVFKDEDENIINPASADYTVMKCSESLNYVKYLLKAVNK